MVTTKVKLMGIVLVGLMLSACTPDTAVPATLPPSRTPAATAMITVTAVAQTPPTTTATNSPTPTPADTIISTSTSQPTSTPRFTFTLGPTPTPFRLDLPDWITDPAANILLVGHTEGEQRIILFNADTGEQYQFYRYASTPEWVWQDGRYFLSPREPKEDREVIDIMTGDVVRLTRVDADVLSPDGRYAARIRREDGFDEVILIDRQTGLETELYNPFLDASRDDYYVDARPYWSSDGMFLAVTYDKYFDDNIYYDLVVYTPSGKVFRQYRNMYTFWDNPWSPVLPNRILYTEGNRPCILDVIENKQTCLATIAEWADNKSVWSFIWSPDGSKISFIHWNSEERENGVCYFELATEEILCPTPCL